MQDPQPIILAAPCRFFNTPRGCKNGDACPDAHIANGAKDHAEMIAKLKMPKKKKDFHKTTEDKDIKLCKFGSTCKNIKNGCPNLHPGQVGAPRK